MPKTIEQYLDKADKAKAAVNKFRKNKGLEPCFDEPYKILAPLRVWARGLDEFGVGVRSCTTSRRVGPMVRRDFPMQ